MLDKAELYTIETEVPPSYLGRLIDFIYKSYLLPQRERFTDVSRETLEGTSSIVFSVSDSKGKQRLRVAVKGSKPIEMKIVPFDGEVTEALIDEIRHDVLITVQIFEEEVRKTTLYFAWREGEKMISEELYGRERKPINRMFLETQILLFIVFITLGIFLFSILGWLTPVVLMAAQFILILYSSKIIARSADWHINESNPTIHILEYHLTMQEAERLRQSYSREKLMTMKKEIYENVLAEKGEIDCEAAGEVFAKYGVACQPENLLAKKVNVYQLVKRAVERFRLPMPEVVISNTMIPNAAASGPSPSRGVVLLTTGLLVQLEEDEILSVLGHELGHLKGRDPLLLYGLSAGEFLFRFYVLGRFFPFVFYSFLLFFYFWAVMTVIYFIAKFFEARADLVSAMVIGQPQALAEALQKIGFRRMVYERAPAFRFQEWISLEPHPPIYFRVERLEKLEVPVKVKYPFIQSLKDVTRGFLETIRM